MFIKVVNIRIPAFLISGFHMVKKKDDIDNITKD